MVYTWEPYFDMKGDLKGYAKNLSFLHFFFWLWIS
jgi:hypothetical protein